MPCIYDDVGVSNSILEARLHRLTAMLCAACKLLEEKKIKLPTKVETTRSANSTEVIIVSLDSWWESHKEQDKQKEQKKKREEDRKKLQKEALKKLSEEEKKALGLKDDH